MQKVVVETTVFYGDVFLINNYLVTLKLLLMRIYVF